MPALISSDAMQRSSLRALARSVVVLAGIFVLCLVGWGGRGHAIRHWVARTQVAVMATIAVLILGGTFGRALVAGGVFFLLAWLGGNWVIISGAANALLAAAVTCWALGLV